MFCGIAVKYYSQHEFTFLKHVSFNYKTGHTLFQRNIIKQMLDFDLKVPLPLEIEYVYKGIFDYLTFHTKRS